MRDWGDVPALPLTLEGLLRWSEGIITNEELDQLLVAIDSLLVRRFVSGVPPNDLRSAFARTMQGITSENGFFRNAINHLNQDRFRWPTDSAFKRALLEQPIYLRGAKYTGLILKAIARADQGHECPAITIGTAASDYSVEHILPQTLSPEWLTDLSEWGVESPYELKNEKADTIGNLTLTAYNSSLSNRRFSEKRAFIQDNLYLKISRAILQDEKWTRGEIEGRSDVLAQTALRIWPRFTAE